MDQQKVGSFIRELRKEKCLSQEQFAETIGVSGRTVSRWETGKNMPDISLLIDISEFFEVGISELIDGERKSEKMKEEMKDEVKEVMESISDYSDEVNNAWNRKLQKRCTLFAGFTFLYLLVDSYLDIKTNTDIDYFWLNCLKSLLFGFPFAGYIVMYMELFGYNKKLIENPKLKKRILIVLKGVRIFAVLLLIILLSMRYTVFIEFLN